MRRFIRGGVFLNSKSASDFDVNFSDLTGCDKILCHDPDGSLVAGDRVRIGQVVGSYGALPQLSPISGVVRSDEFGLYVESDGKNEYYDGFGSPVCANIEELTSDAMTDVIRRAGIPDCSGTSLADRLEKNGAKLREICVCAFDTTPECRVFSELLKSSPRSVANGIKLLMSAYGVKKCTVLVSDSGSALSKYLSDLIVVRKIVPIYPSENEKLVYNLVASKEVGGNKNPDDVGALVIDTSIAVAIEKMILCGIPYTHTPVSVEKSGKVYLSYLPVGSKISDYVDDAIVGTKIGGRLAYMNEAVAPYTHVLCENTNTRYVEPTACIQCRRCFNVCPMYLSPVELIAKAKRSPERVAEYASVCIECGCCSYVCPSSADLSGDMKKIKKGKI